MENNTFSYNYSAKRNREVEKIREKYLAHSESKLERLKRLDLRVRTAGIIEALCLGIIGALIFGVGLCFFLEVFVGMPWLTALLMVGGVVIMIPAYPTHRLIARRKRAKLTPEILRLSDEIIKKQKIKD